MVHAIKMGWIKPKKKKEEGEEEQQYYDIWKDEDAVSFPSIYAL